MQEQDYSWISQTHKGVNILRCKIVSVTSLTSREKRFLFYLLCFLGGKDAKTTEEKHVEKREVTVKGDVRRSQ